MLPTPISEADLGLCFDLVWQSSSEANHRLVSRMRETRLSGSEEGGGELNRLSLPPSKELRGGGVEHHPQGFRPALKRSSVSTKYLSPGYSRTSSVSISMALVTLPLRK
jgi:hypothetical protein